MANEAEQAIYTRLASAPTFHPVTANLFVNDWGLDAGDIVTVRSGETDYSVPIYNMSLDWHGSAMAQIQSTGNKERKPLSAMKRKQFAGGRSNYMAEKAVEHYDTQFIQDKMNIGMIASAMGVVLDENGNPMIDDETGKYVWDDEHGAEIYSRMILEHNRAELVSAINDGTGTKISGAKIDVSAQGKVLIEAINNRPSSQSSVVIQANKIDLNGVVTAIQIDAVKAVVEQLITNDGYAGSISATNLKGTNGNITNLTTSNLYLSNSPSSTSEVTRKGVKIGNGAVSDSLLLLGTGTATNLVIPNAVTHFGNAYVDGEQIKIPYYTHDSGGGTPAGTINFSIADTAKYKADVGISTLGLTSGDAMDYADWNVEDKSTLDAQGYYLVTATPKHGDPVSFKFKTPAGGSGDYETGWAAAEEMVDWPEESTDASFLVKAPSSTVDRQTSRSFVLSQTGNTVYVNMNGTNVATLPVTGGSGTISSMTISSALPSEPSTDYDGGSLMSYNSWYTVSATPNGGTAKAMKFKTPVDNGGVNTIGSAGATYDVSEYNGWNASVLGTVNLGGYYLIEAVATNGEKKYTKFAVPSGNSGISTMSISSGSSTEPSTDFNGGSLSSYNSWYTVTATPNGGTAKTIRFKTPISGSSSVTQINVNSVPKATWDSLTYPEKGVSAGNYYAITTTPSTVGAKIHIPDSSGGSGGINTMSISGALPSEPSADYNGGSLGSYNTWYTITATPNSGTSKSMKFKTPASGGGGHDTVTGNDIDLNGSSAATSASKPSTKLDKKDGYINGYVWFRLSNGTWKNLRDFTISYPQETGSGTKVENLYRKSGNFYFKLSPNKLYYFEE